MRINNTQTNYFYGDAVFQGGLSALSGATFTNTIFTTTSALSVVNTGVGPALYVYQAAGPYDVASFYDGDGVEVLHVGNASGGGNPKGKIGINESNPSAELTVNGAISSNGGITASGGLYLTSPSGPADTLHLQFDNGGNGGNWVINPFIFGVSNGGLSFVDRLASTIPFVISSSGNVGIGTTAPTQKLTVNGTISSNSTITALDGNSTQWNSAYTNANYTNARGIQSFVFASSAINIAAHLASGSPTYNMFTVPTGYRFAADMLQLTVIDTAGGAGTPTVQLQRAFDSQSLAPSLPIPTGATKFNVYSIVNNNTSATIRNTVPPGNVVALATTVATAYTTLSCIAIIKGSLIPTSLYV
jgi:hypothetical protein